MSFAQQAKHHLFEIISEMASHPGDFSNHPETDFSRNRKLDFSNLLKLIVSMETGYVKDELLRLSPHKEIVEEHYWNTAYRDSKGKSQRKSRNAFLAGFLYMKI